MNLCTWKIHFGVTPEAVTRCDKPEHLDGVTSHAEFTRHAFPAGTDMEHAGPGPFTEGQRVTWQAGDRREYTGEWPGPCAATAGCTLHAGHLGRCAP